MKIRELSLFTGGGGGIWGSKLLDWETVGYVEIDEYCQKIISQRIADEIFDRAPIFSDIRAFISEGYAESYQGLVDVITAGFPCQPFSVAGKRKGRNDERNMWPETIRCIRAVRPKWCLLENVPGLLCKHGYFGTILRDLAESGYDARWDRFSAAEQGAPHRRQRLWILAHTMHSGRSPEFGQQQEERAEISNTGSKGNVADTECGRLPRRGNETRDLEEAGASSALERCGWWTSEPNVGRVVNGMANRCDRIRALGNGQVPAVVRAAWENLR